ncbi:hypothetical protein GWK47_023994 [Chionoecetes opilio]|uniref:Uncharacterized protein n=1 Tax=Chionoecetes opilio TaxID=41210 RepID=A0A8J4XLD5_CHIOP|nr:hypothetical protein GWK47_023994 [Chionoecetes opilio]
MWIVEHFHGRRPSHPGDEHTKACMQNDEGRGLGPTLDHVTHVFVLALRPSFSFDLTRPSRSLRIYKPFREGVVDALPRSACNPKCQVSGQSVETKDSIKRI